MGTEAGLERRLGGRTNAGGGGRNLFLSLNHQEVATRRRMKMRKRGR
jgi:hypothetical protein